MQVNTRILWADHPWQGFAIELRKLLGNLTVGEITSIFQALNFSLQQAHLERERLLILELGQRKARAQSFLERIAWTSEPSEVLENVLRRTDRVLRGRFPMDATAFEQPIFWELEQIGYNVNAKWEVVTHAELIADVKLPETATGIQIELDRLQRMILEIDSDPHAILGKTKDLVEATCKVVIRARGVDIPKHATLGELAKLAEPILDLDLSNERVLGFHKIVLGGLRSILSSIGAVRNKVQGAGGHGSAVVEEDIDAAFVRLFADSGIAWSRFFLAHLDKRSFK